MPFTYPADMPCRVIPGKKAMTYAEMQMVKPRRIASLNNPLGALLHSLGFDTLEERTRIVRQMLADDLERDRPRFPF